MKLHVINLAQRRKARNWFAQILSKAYDAPDLVPILIKTWAKVINI